MGQSLIRLANSMVKGQKENTSVTALHLCPNHVLHHYNLDEYENDSFDLVIKESENLDQKITTLFKASDNIENDITEISNKGSFDLLLIGIGQSIFEGSLLGKILGYTTRIVNPDRLIQKVSGKEKLFRNSPFDARTQYILSNSNIPVGVFVNKNTNRFDQVIAIFYSENDEFLLEYIQRLITNSDSQITVTDPTNVIRNRVEIKEAIRAIEQEAPNHITLIQDIVIDENFLSQFQMLIISTEGWKKIIDSRQSWLSKTPSILMLQI